MLAAYAGRLEVVKMLIKQPHILVNLRNSQGETAIIIALKKRHDDVARVLLEHPGIDTSITDLKGNSASTLMKSVDLEDIIIRTLTSAEV